MHRVLPTRLPCTSSTSQPGVPGVQLRVSVLGPQPVPLTTVGISAGPAGGTSAGTSGDPASPPVVRRTWVEAPSGHEVSALVWGDEPAEYVLLHGGAQNAHTWDTLALALGRPLVAIDLPGHGHSDWRDDHDYRPQAMADDIAFVIEALTRYADDVVESIDVWDNGLISHDTWKKTAAFLKAELDKKYKA